VEVKAQSALEKINRAYGVLSKATEKRKQQRKDSVRELRVKEMLRPVETRDPPHEPKAAKSSSSSVQMESRLPGDAGFELFLAACGNHCWSKGPRCAARKAAAKRERAFLLIILE
jgi:hypothetical protein